MTNPTALSMNIQLLVANYNYNSVLSMPPINPLSYRNRTIEWMGIITELEAIISNRVLSRLTMKDKNSKEIAILTKNSFTNDTYVIEIQPGVSVSMVLAISIAHQLLFAALT